MIQSIRICTTDLLTGQTALDRKLKFIEYYVTYVGKQRILENSSPKMVKYGMKICMADQITI